MNLPSLKDSDIKDKRVLVRADLDVKPEDFEDSLRIRALLPTLDYISEDASQIILMGHRGRPEGEDENLSMRPLAEKFEVLLEDRWGKEKLNSLDMHIMENLRFNNGEESNDLHFAEEIADHGDFYINEAFSASHREHASIVAIPTLLPHAVGLRFSEEVNNLSKIFESSEKPVMAIISGLKEDKLAYVEAFRKFADKILIAGRLPEYIHDDSPLRKSDQFIVANLLADKEDITLRSIEDFEEEIKSAKTIVVSGPMGRFEDAGHSQGTKRVLEAVANSGAFTVAGGGDTESAISMLNLNDKFDWISVGGGAMLEFLANGTLPGINALEK